jgi:hypothetical protein
MDVSTVCRAGTAGGIRRAGTAGDIRRAGTAGDIRCATTDLEINALFWLQGHISIILFLYLVNEKRRRDKEHDRISIRNVDQIKRLT